MNSRLSNTQIQNVLTIVVVGILGLKLKPFLVIFLTFSISEPDTVQIPNLVKVS